MTFITADNRQFSKGSFTFSDGTAWLNGTTLELRLSDFNLFGSNGAADFLNIGAFILTINGAGVSAANIGVHSMRSDASSIPEPMTFALLAGALPLLMRRRHNRSKFQRSTI